MDARERWQRLVVARREQMDAAYARLGRTSADFWARRAGRFQVMRPVAQADDPAVQVASELAGPQGTILDVGAGTGRLTLALAPSVARVTAVEPSEAMIGLLRNGVTVHGLTNVEAVETRWEEAEVAPADVVVCANVLYPIEQPEPFIRRLKEHARRAVVLQMMVTWAEPPLMAELWRRFHGDERVGQPEAFDTIALLHEMGIPAHVRVAALPRGLPMWRFETLDDAVATAREHLILPDDPDVNEALRAALDGALVPTDGVGLLLPEPERSTALIWWEMDGPRRVG